MGYWRWENHRRCLEQWSDGKTLAEIEQVIEAITAATRVPEGTYPGTESLDGRADIHRELRVGDVRIVFTVCDPFVRGLLHMVLIEQGETP